MPMFYIPKPRRFNYQPRFYDPKKERWEELKAKYAIEKSTEDYETTDAGETTISDDKELAYFQEKVRQMEHKDKEKSRGLTWKDAFRKREMPEFHYTPRFQNMPDAEAKPADTAEQRLADAKERNIRIKRRFDVNRTFQRKQQSVWIKVAVVLMIFYLVYRYYGAITQYIYNLFF